MHKLQGVMHDTCNTANKTARLGKVLRETSGQLFFGYDEWETRAEEDKPWFDFLCGNHTMVTPICPTGSYKDPCRTRQCLDVKIAML